MNSMNRYSRRILLRTGTGAGIATALGFAFPAPGVRRALAQNGDTELVCNSNGVRIRRNAALSGAVIGSLSSGAVVNVIGDPVTRDGYTWLNISPQGNRNLNGWAAAQFFGEPSGGGWAIGTNVVVATDTLNLRADPGIRGRVVRSARNGTHAVTRTAAVSRDGYTWYGVTLDDGTRGYFAGEFLEVARSEPTGDRLRVVDGPLRLRESPGLNGSVLTTLSTGAIVVIADASSVRQDGYLWRYVRVESNPNLIGWIADGFTERIG